MPTFTKGGRLPRRLVVICLLLSFALGAAPRPPAIRVTTDEAALDFPNRITFSVDLQSAADIQRVVLEYGVEQQTCGTVIAKAFPDFTPGRQVAATWTWEMLQSGSEPPGAQIWWRWRVTDSAGYEWLTERKTVTWLDSQHPWQALSRDSLNLHWYGGGAAFGRELLDSATASLAALQRDTGLAPDAPIDLYIYADTTDMRDAVLYEPGWTGGEAFAEYNIVIIGIAPSQIEWGKRAQAHELTHVLVGHLTFSCLINMPTWLNEGLAVYGEGGPDPASLGTFDAAVADDTLFSVRALSGNFSEDPAKADLSYVESYSLVQFLIDQYGREEMLALLGALRDGAPLASALQAVYGFDVDGFEDAWRAQLGARPRASAGQPATATPAPTPVPTIVPLSGAPLGPTLAPTRVRETPTPYVPPERVLPPVDTSPALIEIGLLLCLAAACALVALAGVLIAVLVSRRRR